MLDLHALFNQKYVSGYVTGLNGKFYEIAWTELTYLDQTCALFWGKVLENMAESWDFQSLYRMPGPAIPYCCDEVLTALMTWHCQYQNSVSQKHILLWMNKFHHPTNEYLHNWYTTLCTSSHRSSLKNKERADRKPMDTALWNRPCNINITDIKAAYFRLCVSIMLPKWKHKTS
jgi:hypothetical protein